MLIILEGCDATGKTTLANLLAPVLNATIIHCTAETPNDMQFFTNIAWAAAQKNIIADRFCYSQFVYQSEVNRPLFTNEPESYWVSSWDALYSLETKLLKCDTKVIYTYASQKDIADRMIARGENPDCVGGILDGYTELWKKTLIKPIFFRT